jgi:hypothetical protein
MSNEGSKPHPPSPTKREKAAFLFLINFFTMFLSLFDNKASVMQYLAQAY